MIVVVLTHLQNGAPPMWRCEWQYRTRAAAEGVARQYHAAGFRCRIEERPEDSDPVQWGSGRGRHGRA